MHGTGLDAGLKAFIGASSQGLAWVAGLLLLLMLLSAGLRPGRKRRGRYRSRDAVRPDQGQGAADRAMTQMQAVVLSGYERVPLLNREEARLLPVLERVVRGIGRGHRVMAQVSLGEVIRPSKGAPEEARAAINSKRIDLGIFDARGLLVCAVEYQGTGHWQNSAAMRDAVKREALRKAGVRLIEVHPDFIEDTLARQVSDLLGEPPRNGVAAT